MPLGIARRRRGASFDAAGAPLALFGRNMPVAALIPLTILWFGIDETQKVMFIFIACVPFVFSDARRARSPSVPERYVETAQTLGASPWQIVTQGARRRSRCPTSSTACGTCSAWRSATSCSPS